MLRRIFGLLTICIVAWLFETGRVHYPEINNIFLFGGGWLEFYIWYTALIFMFFAYVMALHMLFDERGDACHLLCLMFCTLFVAGVLLKISSQVPVEDRFNVLISEKRIILFIIPFFTLIVILVVDAFYEYWRQRLAREVKEAELFKLTHLTSIYE